MADAVSKPDWEERYRSKKPLFERLASEIEFALDSKIRHEGIKIHSLLSRVKSAESIEEKSKRKELSNPLEQLDDIVGIRVVALFLSDLPRLHNLIHDSFEIHASEDKVTGNDPASFGYMSIHYVASLDSQHSGPRYDDLKGLRFEVQTRTVVMDAWANVSHHLDYKGASSIPEELRKDFFALSGLFYVADQHFEIFADRARKSQLRAKQELRESPDEVAEINLDTVEAYLAQRYKDRKHADRASISEFVEEVTRAGYSDLGALGDALDRGTDRFLEYERPYPPRESAAAPPWCFSDLGAGRITLALTDKDYARSIYDVDEDEPLKKFALWS